MFALCGECCLPVEIVLITNKSLFVASSWFLFHLFIKDARSFEHKTISNITVFNYFLKICREISYLIKIGEE